MRERVATTVRLAAWCAVLVVAARVLAATGSETLTIPLTSVRALATWSAETPPADMAIAVLRLGGLAACGYLLAVTALGVAARLLGLRWLAGAVGRVTPAAVRRLVAGGSGVGLAVGTLIGALPVPDVDAGPARSTVAAVPGAPTPDRATMSRLEPAAARGTATMTSDDAAAAATPPGAATMIREGEPATSATMTRTADGPAAAPTAPPPPAAAAGGPVPVAPAATPVATPLPVLPTVDPAVWVVEPGDSLWSIADEVVREVRPHASSREVAAYWRGLVVANRASLVDAANPDLLVPGQEITVPPPAP